MPWVLSTNDGQLSYPAPAGETLYLVPNQGDTCLTAARDKPEDASLILGTLAVFSYGVRLEAGSENLIISPPSARTARKTSNGNPPVEGILLQAKTDSRVETIILRHQDRVSSASDPAGPLVLEWIPPQIQVQSSEKNIEAAETGDETEEGDDEDLDNTVVPISKSQTMRSTPHLSLSHSVVIQETPTINRTTDLGELIENSEHNEARTGRRTLRKETSATTVVLNSTAPTKQSIVHDVSMSEGLDDEGKPESSDLVLQKPRQPNARVYKSKASKRASPVQEEQSTPAARAPKRLKTSDADTVSTPAQSARKTATKKKQTPKASATPPRSQRSTPISTAESVKGSPIQVDGDYDGPKPRVALSNSSIQPTSSFVRFLKKQGGAIVDAIEGDCNILCIKPGPPSRTAKLLQAIAHGIPIVTDTWLISSTQATRLLPLSPYAPPELASVWKIPQDRLFKGYTIYFTPSCKAQYGKAAFTDVEKLCKAVGARRVVSKKPGGKDLDKETVYFVEGRGDPDGAVLRGMGHACYTKEFLTQSVVAGEVDWKSGEWRVEEEEGDVEGEEEEKPVKKKGRARKG